MRKVACPSRCTVPSGSVQLGEAVPARSIYELLRNSATAFDDRTALSFVHDADDLSTVERYRYRDLFAGCLRTANLLDALEPGSTKVISVLLPACLEYHLALWGGTTAGIVQPLNPLLSEEKLAALMNAAGSSFLIAWGSDADAPYWSRAQRLRELVPTLRHLVRVGPSGDDDADPSTGATIVDFAEATRDQPDDRLVSNRRIEPEDIAGYFHTGGTTSEPKLARLSHGAIVFTAWTCVHLQGLTEGHVSINAYPLFHVAGALTTSLPSFSSGGEVVMPTSTLLRNWRVVQNYWKLFEHFRATELSVVPTGLAALVDVPLDGADISRLRYCRTGAAALSPELAERFTRATGRHVHECLGMSSRAARPRRELSSAPRNRPSPRAHVRRHIPCLAPRHRDAGDRRRSGLGRLRNRQHQLPAPERWRFTHLPAEAAGRNSPSPAGADGHRRIDRSVSDGRGRGRRTDGGGRVCDCFPDLRRHSNVASIVALFTVNPDRDARKVAFWRSRVYNECGRASQA